MSAKVTADFKRDFDYCMEHWQSLKDGFTADDVTEAKAFARMIVADDDKLRIAEMESWFKQEAGKIKVAQDIAAGITERIRDMEKAA